LIIKKLYGNLYLFFRTNNTSCKKRYKLEKDSVGKNKKGKGQRGEKQKGKEMRERLEG
jgi:hypothetical protein